MYSIKVEDHFSSAHNLRGYKGKCEELHGHNWKVEIVVRRKDLDKIGMVLDFKFLKMQLKKALDKLDHKHLNRLPYFKKVNPTSEQIAKYLFDTLSRKISELSSVTVWESENSCAQYEE